VVAFAVITAAEAFLREFLLLQEEAPVKRTRAAYGWREVSSALIGQNLKGASGVTRSRTPAYPRTRAQRQSDFFSHIAAVQVQGLPA
jgi:hypothetical protein